jgi:hypothetical protein
VATAKQPLAKLCLMGKDEPWPADLEPRLLGMGPARNVHPTVDREPLVVRAWPKQKLYRIGPNYGPTLGL